MLNKKSVTKTLCMVLATACLLATVAGCKPKETVSGSFSPDVDVKFPLAEPVTLQYWGTLPAAGLTMMSNFGESEMYKELEKRTGVKIEFLHPAAGQEIEQLNIMLASGELPDLIQDSFNTYSGGIRKVYELGLIHDLTELQKLYAPNLTKIYNEFPELLLDAKTEDGQFLRVPFIRGHSTLRAFMGPAVRGDWLKDLGMETPTTIDEWHEMLTAFKNEKKAEVPLIVDTTTLRYPSFMGAYGIINDYYIVDQKVVFGPSTPQYKEYLTEMAKWYKEGLISSEFALSNNSTNTDALMMNDKAGAIVAYAGGTIGRFMNLMAEKDPKFSLDGVQYPVINEGDKPIFLKQDPIYNPVGGVSISATCKNPEVAMAWLDYGYGDEGHMLYNFGIEGVSYTMEDGYPKYTDLIQKNPDGHAFSNIASLYFRAISDGPFVQDRRYIEQYLALPQQQEAIKAWTKFSAEAAEANTTLRGTLTSEENSQVASKLATIATYVDEMFVKFVMGQESLDNYDDYIKKLEQLGLQDAIDVKQAAHDRFLANNKDALNVKDFNVNDIYEK